MVDIGAYMQRQKDRLSQETSQIRDPSVFDFNYIPDQPLMREECKGLIDAMLRFDLTGIPTNMAIIGSRGSGKTLTLKLLQKEVPRQTHLNVLYANCRHHNTSFKILAHFLNVEARGASLSELYERFSRGCPGRTVVILDEVDLMSLKDRRREILYLLSRSEIPFMVIMLSNSPHVLKELDAATRSSLQPRLVHFPNYNAEQIHEILRDRARKGLYHWDDGHLAEIAALTARKTNADTRVAIKTLCYTVTERPGDVANCFEQARRDIVVDLINDLANPALMILWAAATNQSDLARDIYNRYCRFSQGHQEKPFSYVYFYSNLSYLQSVGLIALVSAKVDRTYTNRVLLAFDRTVLEPIIRFRFDTQ